ncbi:MAG TPA: DNA-protecting protein DprA [Spirochaetes bacterium]|nr:DNA-protecting protein DprA [Spirochaetota bacterium]
MGGDETVYAIALSVMASPAFNDVWESVSLSSSREAYLRCAAGRRPATQQYLADLYPAEPLEAAERIYRACEKNSTAVITCRDPRYPALLREISKPPVVLYASGELPDRPCVAIVGTRGADHRSLSVARRLSAELAQKGCAIVSGMAVGIDRQAHAGALGVSGATVGVLANGIDVVYPYQNRDIYKQVLESGTSCLVSEYPPGIRAGRWSFTRRNRIISGLSLGTVVVMAGMKSGALITARYGLEQNREVFACPGHSFDRAYEGCHNLIRQGAHLVGSTADVLRELGLEDAPEGREETMALDFGPPREAVEPGPLERHILENLTDGEKEIDALIRQTGKDTGDVLEALVNMELSGLIVRSGNTVSLC